jgi:MFS transporter, FSR family, fosmidomycin resistance protein
MNAKTSFSYRLPAALGIAHGVSDGAAGLLLGSLATNSSATQITLLVLIYNALAFGSQPLIGYVADSLPSPRVFASGGMILLAASLVSRASGYGELAVLMAGLGSAAFHVGAGALTLRSCAGRSDAAGLFAAPGVIGLALGGALAVSGHYLYLPFFVALFSCSRLGQYRPAKPLSRVQRKNQSSSLMIGS